MTASRLAVRSCWHCCSRQRRTKCSCRHHRKATLPRGGRGWVGEDGGPSFDNNRAEVRANVVMTVIRVCSTHPSNVSLLSGVRWEPSFFDARVGCFFLGVSWFTITTICINNAPSLLTHSLHRASMHLRVPACCCRACCSHTPQPRSSWQSASGSREVWSRAGQAGLVHAAGG